MEEVTDIRVVEHTADWALCIRGRDLSALFSNAAVGLARLLVEDCTLISLDVEQRITVEAPDVETLLVGWLEELAFWAEMEMLVFVQIDVCSVTADRLTATVRGGRVGQLQKHVKAVTYHNLQVAETRSGLEATVVFDV